MLYSKKIKLDKERTIKIGIRETLILLNKGISVLEDLNPKTLMEILLVGLQREDKDLTMDKLIDIFDESELSYADLKTTVNAAIIFGLGKEDIEESNNEVQEPKN